eukprot:6027267-Pleurochrysis_carterae.AAC.2
MVVRFEAIGTKRLGKLKKTYGCGREAFAFPNRKPVLITMLANLCACLLSVAMAAAVSRACCMPIVDSGGSSATMCRRPQRCSHDALFA